MKTLRMLVLLVLIVWLVAPATHAAAETVVLAPLVVEGDYRPPSPEALQQALLGEVRRIHPQGRFVMPAATQLAAAGYADGWRPPSREAVEQLGRACRGTYVAWLSLRFSPRLSEVDPGGARVLSMTGAVRFWAMRVYDGRVIVDAPLTALGTAVVPAGADRAAIEAEADQLVAACISDLAGQLVTLGQQEAARARVQSWAGAAGEATPPPGAYSDAYQDMVAALSAYNAAIANQDLLSSSDAQRRCLAAWPLLSPEEQQRVDRFFPGTRDWMNSGSTWNGGWYYPYRWRPR